MISVEPGADDNPQEKVFLSPKQHFPDGRNRAHGGSFDGAVGLPRSHGCGIEYWHGDVLRTIAERSGARRSGLIVGATFLSAA